MKKYKLITFIALLAFLQSCSVVDPNFHEIEVPSTQTITVKEFPKDGIIGEIQYQTKSDEVSFGIEEISIDNSDWFGHGFSGVLSIDERGEITTPWPHTITTEIFPDGIEVNVYVNSGHNEKFSEAVKLKINIEKKDAIKENLTTSLSNYENAKDDDWVEVTRAEYNLVQEAYYDSKKIGVSDARIEEAIISPASAELWAPGGDDGVSISFINDRIIDSNFDNHFGALIGVCYFNPSEGIKEGCNAKTAEYEGETFKRKGNVFPPHEGIGMHYFVHKKENREVRNGDKYLGFYAKDLGRYIPENTFHNCSYTVGDSGYHPFHTFAEYYVQGFFSSERQR